VWRELLGLTYRPERSILLRLCYNVNIYAYI
jgi:hypothetical protein